ncbi:MAG TPA: S4 domain-containing protein, partial [Candidatus Limnocylindrales bacterium]
MPTERLQKILAAAGVASRRGAEALIEAGRVSVDGLTATIGQQVDPATAAIAVDGRPISRSAAVAHVYLAVDKPVGVTSTVRDRHAVTTVIDLVPAALRPASGRLFPVGRLDQDSEGLILLTDDGD